MAKKAGRNTKAKSHEALSYCVVSRTKDGQMRIECVGRGGDFPSLLRALSPDAPLPPTAEGSVPVRTEGEDREEETVESTSEEENLL